MPAFWRAREDRWVGLGNKRAKANFLKAGFAGVRFNYGGHRELPVKNASLHSVQPRPTGN